MKRSLKFLSLLVMTGMVMASCEGPMGPAGEKGDKGDKGDAGTPGAPGSTLACSECHNTDDQIVAFSAQWSESMHANGGNAGYANRDGCAQCHTSQGFLAFLATGATAKVENPMQINCYTCHKIHKTYTDDDWALTNGGAKNLDVQYKGAAVAWDKGASNQCVSCHQERVVSPAPVLDGADFVVASSRIGPHHGPNANLILGKHPFEIPGTVTYPTTNPHSTASGCLTCHMAEPYGYTAGGHNMGVFYDSHGTELMLQTGCVTCHTTPATLTTLINGLHTDFDAKLAALEAKLIAANIYNASTGLARTGTFKANAVLAYLNYNTLKEDRSRGLHNPGYSKALLDNSIQAMTALGF